MQLQHFLLGRVVWEAFSVFMVFTDIREKQQQNETRSLDRCSLFAWGSSGIWNGKSTLNSCTGQTGFLPQKPQDNSAVFSPPQLPIVPGVVKCSSFVGLKNSELSAAQRPVRVTDVMVVVQVFAPDKIVPAYFG